MNKIYKVVWSKVKNCYVVVSEIAKNVLTGGVKSAKVGCAPIVKGMALGALMTFVITGNLGSVNAETINDNLIVNGTVTINDMVISTSGNGYTGIVIGNGATSNKDFTVSIGYNSLAEGMSAVAIGDAAKASSSSNISLGQHAESHGEFSMALGLYSYASGNNSVAFGENAVSKHNNSVAIGYGSVTQDVDTVSFGHKKGDLVYGSGSASTYNENYYRRLTNVADGIDSHDVATRGQLDVLEAEVAARITDYDTYYGAEIYKLKQDKADKSDTLAGYGITDAYNKGEVDSVIAGAENRVIEAYRAADSTLESKVTTVEGEIDVLQTTVRNQATAIADKVDAGVTTDNTGLAIGSSASAGVYSTSIGYGAKANDEWSVAVGYKASASGDHTIAIGDNAIADGGQGFAPANIALGLHAVSTGEQAMALGVYANAYGADSVALGSSSVAVDGNTVSFGHKAGDKYGQNKEATFSDDLYRRLTNVADGVNAHDVATVGQLNAIVDSKANTSDVYTKTEVDTSMSNKADKATSLEGYGITDAYTKSEVNDLLSNSVGGTSVDAYTKTEVDAKLKDFSVISDSSASIKKQESSFIGSMVADDLDNPSKAAMTYVGFDQDMVDEGVFGINSFVKDGQNKSFRDQTATEIHDAVYLATSDMDGDATQINRTVKTLSSTVSSITSGAKSSALKQTVDGWAFTVNGESVSISGNDVVVGKNSFNELANKVEVIGSDYLKENDKNQLVGAIANKADVSYVESSIANVTSAYQMADTAIENKLTQAYQAVDSALSGRIDETQASIALKANAGDVYTNTEIDT